MGRTSGSGLGIDGMAVADDLAEVSQVLVAAKGVEATVALICRLAVEHIPGCQAAGILMLGRGALRSLGTTNEAARKLDDLQIERSQGPCVEALHTQDVVRVDDFWTDDRWGSFGPAAAAESGIRSVLAHGLRAAERTMGALNLYSSVPYAFDDDTTTSHLAELYASHAAVALAGAQAVDGLQAALETRATISAAMGILMARERITRLRAFDVLRRASQRQNAKVRDIAARIVKETEGVIETE